MGWLAFALGLAMPAIVGAGQLRLISPEYGVAFIWIAFALAVVAGMVDRLQQTREPARRGLSSLQPHLAARPS